MARIYVEINVDPDLLSVARNTADSVNLVFDEWLEQALRAFLWDLAKKTDNDLLVMDLEESYNRTEPFWGNFHHRHGHSYGAGKLYRSLLKH